MPNLLEVDRVDAIGFVDKGANQKSYVAFWKRLVKGQADDGESFPKQGDGHMDFDVTTLPDEAQEYIKGLEAKVEKTDEGGLKSWLKEQFAGLRTESGDTGDGDGGAGDGASDDGDGDGDVDPLDKAAPEIRKAMTDLEKRAADAEKVAKDAEGRVQKLEDERRAEAIAKRVSDEMGFIADEKTAALMKRVSDSVSVEDFDALMERQRAANEMVRQSKLFKELGAGGSGGDMTAHDEVDKRAKERVEKAGGKLTYEQAYSDELRDDPELADRVNTEAN